MKNLLQCHIKMESEAFGSPVHYNARVSTTIGPEERGVGEGIHSVIRGNLFNEEDELLFSGMADRRSEIVQLLGDEGDVVGEGVLEKNITYRMELHDVKLCPSEVAIRVTRSIDKNKWVGEIVGDLLCDCVGELVWWHCVLVQTSKPLKLTSRNVERERRKFHFSLESIAPSYFCDVEVNVSSSIFIPSSANDTTTLQGNSPGP